MERNFEEVDRGSELWRAIPSDLREVSTAAVILSQKKAALWALVLESRSIPCHADQDGAGWILRVPVENFLSALDELRQFEEENRNWPPLTLKAPPLLENSLSTLSVLLLLATFHNVTRLDIHLLGYTPVPWLDLGSAQAGKILDGQWWRTVTSLTLHAGVIHLLGNLTIGGFFIVYLCRDLGSGLAWILLVLSGALGTVANAWFQPEYHTSIGASTLVFGAVGILASLQVIRGNSKFRKTWFLPLAGALALLAMLGTEGENTDIGAHLFGFLFGILFGLIGAYLVGKTGRPGSRINALLAVCAVAIPLVAWWVALTAGR